MFRLIKIDWLKNNKNRAFWVLLGLYFISIGGSLSLGMVFLNWLKRLGADFDEFDPTRIPLYHFPDIWQNFVYFATFFKYVLGIVIIIGITNEFSFKTVRQNIIDGLDRKDFLKSKVLTILLIALAASIFVFLIGIIVGSIYTPSEDMRFILKDVEFVFGFFIEMVAFMLLALLIGTLVKRSGLAIGLLFLYTLMIEPIITFNLPDSWEAIIPYFPVRAIAEVVKVPYQRYIFMEIRDYLSFGSLAVITVYCCLFVYLTYQLLRKRDLQ